MQKDGYGNLFRVFRKIRHANTFVLFEQIDLTFLSFFSKFFYSSAFSELLNLSSCLSISHSPIFGHQKNFFCDISRNQSIISLYLHYDNENLNIFYLIFSSDSSDQTEYALITFFVR